MADIKPAEVSAILREQLSGFRSEAELQEVGTVLQVGDGIARIYGMNGVQYGELIEFDGGMQGIALNLEEDNVGAVLLGRSSGVKEGGRTGLSACVIGLLFSISLFLDSNFLTSAFFPATNLLMSSLAFAAVGPFAPLIRVNCSCASAISICIASIRSSM